MQESSAICERTSTQYSVIIQASKTWLDGSENVDLLCKGKYHIIALWVTWYICGTSALWLQAVWPDLAKFCQFSKNLEIFSNI